MDEDISIINTNTRNEKIKNFFIQNKKKIILVLGVIVILLIGYFAFGEYQDSKKMQGKFEGSLKLLVDLFGKQSNTWWSCTNSKKCFC